MIDNRVITFQVHPDKGKYGPSISCNDRQAVVWMKGNKLLTFDVNYPFEAMAGLMACYYLLHLTYPARYGQLLGAIQHMCTNDEFKIDFQSKKLQHFIQSFS
jgi:hypothetical protein